MVAANADFDRTIAERFGQAHHLASQGHLPQWENEASGTLALLILTDQFARNIYRGSAHAFATDPLARAISERGIARFVDRIFEPALRQFFYLPFSHHEDADSQARAVALYEAMIADGGDPAGLRFARLHADLISRFGRFPHRNLVMGRIPTPQELAYLAQGGFAG